jgi:hypothetical protein
MARYSAFVKSSTALAVDTTFAALTPAAAVGFKLRRVTIGVVAGATTPTSQQLTFGINRGSARGTATTTVAGQKLDIKSSASNITGLDTVWSTAPTLGSADQYRASFNSQSGIDLPWELLEEFCSDVGTANPICFVNRDNALPTSHAYTLSVEWEE